MILVRLLRVLRDKLFQVDLKLLTLSVKKESSLLRFLSYWFFAFYMPIGRLYSYIDVLLNENLKVVK